MRATYDDVMRRLKEERNRLSMTQKQIAQIIRMTQSNYNKVELGIRRLNYCEIIYLCESEIDIFYVFTGRRSSCKQYTAFFCNYNYLQLCNFLNVIYSIVLLQNGKEVTENREIILEQIKYVPLFGMCRNIKDVFCALRRSKNYQQKKMAEELGVDIKKLRDLEKGRSLPDSELLWRLYDIFCVSPMVLLKDKKGLCDELCWLLDCMGLKLGGKVFEIMKDLQDME